MKMTAKQFESKTLDLAAKSGIRIWYRVNEKLKNGKIKFTGLDVGTQTYDKGWKNDISFKLKADDKTVDFWDFMYKLLEAKIYAVQNIQ